MKNNLMIRMMTLMILVPMLIAHFMGQTDLLAPNWLWLSAFAALMGFQATFTGWCPSNLIGKFSKTGECCPEGSCSTTKTDSVKQEKASSACCSGESEADNGCCSDAGKSSDACCDGQKASDSECCSDESKAEGGCCGSTSGLEVKVLGTGCANCNNTAKLIESIAAEQGVSVHVVKVEDTAEIVSYGVMSTPAVVINEEVVHAGGIPTKQKIQEWLEKA